MATSLPPFHTGGQSPDAPADLRVVIDLTEAGHRNRPQQAPEKMPNRQPTPRQPPSPPGPPSPLRVHRFVDGDTPAVGFQRMATGLLDDAISALDTGVPSDQDIHAVRKAIRRLRALLRLFRNDLGEVYRVENQVLRDTARLLSDVRSSAVASDALGRLSQHFGELLKPGIYDELFHQLERRHRDIAGRVLENRLLLAGAAANLAKARARIAAFPTAPGHDYGYHGPLIEPSSDTLEAGLERTYSTGLASMKAAAEQPFPEQLHAWRKAAKYLQYQIDALQPAWPEVMAGLCSSLDALSDTLGYERDLWELSETVRGEPGLCPDAAARDLLMAMAIEVRDALRHDAFRLGTQIYTERPDRFAERVRSYWDAWSVPSAPMSP